MTYPIGDEVLDLRMQAALDTDELARLRRGLQATHQALLDAQAELERCHPVAAAAHAYCSAALAEAPDEVMACKALFAAHRATTPSQSPPTHVIVAVDELERLREIATTAHDCMTASDARELVVAGDKLRDLVAPGDGAS